MSLIPRRAQEAPEDQAAAARNLVRRCGLSEQDVDRILGLQRNEELSFTEAALRLGLASQADVDQATENAPRQEPESRGQASPILETVAAPHGSYAERIRSLRTELQLRRDSFNYRALAVISASPRDGRSRVAAELAIACSQMQQPTLLVDADLRSPVQHGLFKLPSDVGLAQALEHDATPRVHGVEGLDHLHVLVAGAAPENPAELLSRPAFGELLAGFSRRYQHVIIDTPAAGPCADALAIARSAGAVLLVLRAGASPMAAAQELSRRLTATQAQLLGVAMTGQ